MTGAVSDTRSLDESHGFVLVAYGDSPFLPGCLRSLSSQTRTTSVAISTSTPSPYIAETASAFGVPVLINPEKRGIAADWNFALTATSARRVTLAHQDDVYLSRFAEVSLALLADHPQAALCFTGYDEITDGGAARQSKISVVKHALERMSLGAETVVSPKRFRAFLSFGNPLPCSSVTFDRAKLGDFKFSSDYRSNLDWDAWLRLAEQGRTFVRTPERLVGRRHNALTATSGLIRDGVRRREDLSMFRRLWPRPLADAIAWAYQASY